MSPDSDSLGHTKHIRVPSQNQERREKKLNKGEKKIEKKKKGEQEMEVAGL